MQAGDAGAECRALAFLGRLVWEPRLRPAEFLDATEYRIPKPSVPCGNSKGLAHSLSRR